MIMFLKNIILILYQHKQTNKQIKNFDNNIESMKLYFFFILDYCLIIF